MVVLYKLVSNTVAFDNLKSIGLDLISNDSIRESMSILYGYDYKLLTDYHNASVTELREDFGPTLNNNVNIHRALSKSDLEYLRNDVGINSRLTGMMSRRNRLRRYFLMAKSYVKEMIANIDTELERLEN